MPTALVTAPTAEPLTVAEVKPHIRQDGAFDDLLIAAMIVAVRQFAENVTRRAFVTQSWKRVMDQFPSPGVNIGSANWYGPQWGTSPGPMTTLRPDGKTGFEIYLDHCPIQTVDSISYVDTAGVTQTLSSSLYVLDNVSEPSRIVPAYGSTWPGTLNQINSVTVNYTCGYGAAAAVPQGIKNWMLMRIAAMYENREEVVSGRSITVTPIPFVDAMLDMYRVLEF